MAERTKCMDTGKVSFPSLMEARLAMFLLKWGYKRHRDENGKHLKHRQGRPVQRRVYYCIHCYGYHLTRWTKGDFRSYEEWKKEQR